MKPATLLFWSTLNVALGAAAVSAQDASAPENRPPQDRAEDLLRMMSLEDKVGQLNQASYDGAPEHLAKIKDWARQGRLGAVLNANGAKAFNELQSLTLAGSRVKIPLLNGVDVIHGYRTQFPIPLAQACSWDPGLVEKAARVAAVEARAGGVNWTFAPMIDIARDPRWGRIAESAGEDPFLTSVMGAAMIRGFQTRDLTSPEAVLACAKHFAGYGAAEAGRDYNTTLIPETELRNVYLRPFRTAVNAGALTFMAAFNDLNGVPASANPFLLKTILRDEWRFDGFVVSDWDSVKELVVHGYAADRPAAAELAFKAGVDMDMVSRVYAENLVTLVRSGKVPLKAVDEAVRRILYVKFASGLFDHPFAVEGRENVWLAPEHRQLARELASQSIVLLKNAGAVLPFQSGPRRLALVGPLADSPADMLGTWHCQGRAEDAVTVAQGLRAAFPDSQLTVVPALARANDRSLDGIPAAVAAAAGADVVIACLGESESMSGEARSRAFLELPGAQAELLAALKKTGKPVIAIVFSGRPLVLDAVTANADAVLFAWHPGTEAGNAIADLLSGARTPSGKLTTTFPRTVGQVPLYYNHRNTGRPAEQEDLDAPMGTPQDPRGFTSKYLDVHSTPAFPFGFGLSYTTFNYRDLKVSEPDAAGLRQVQVTVDNTGGRDGYEVVQLYVRDPVASLTRPVRELKGFARVAIAAGKSETVTLRLPRDYLGFFNSEGKFVVEPGKFEIFVGGDSTATLSTSFELSADEIKPRT